MSRSDPVWPDLPLRKRIRRWLTWKRLPEGGARQRLWLVLYMRLRHGPEPEW